MAGPRVAVVGAGAWGTTLARLIGGVEPVSLLCRSAEVADEIGRTRRNEGRLPGIELPAAVVATADPAVLADATDLVIFATPSRHLRGTVLLATPHLSGEADIVSVVKGLEAGSLPASAVIASTDPELAQRVVAPGSGAGNSGST